MTSSPGFDLGGLGDGVASERADRALAAVPPPPPRELHQTRQAPSSVPPPVDSSPSPPTTRRVRPRRANKVTLRLHSDQRELLRDLAERLELFRTQVTAMSIDQFLDDVRKAGAIEKIPRRPRGPLQGELLLDYQIEIDAARAKRVEDVAAKVSDGDFSAVMRAVLDRAFVAAGFELGERPPKPRALTELLT